jgi:hypothetical protein
MPISSAAPRSSRRRTLAEPGPVEEELSAAITATAMTNTISGPADRELVREPDAGVLDAPASRPGVAEYHMTSPFWMMMRGRMTRSARVVGADVKLSNRAAAIADAEHDDDVEDAQNTPDRSCPAGTGRRTPRGCRGRRARGSPAITPKTSASPVAKSAYSPPRRMP